MLNGRRILLIIGGGVAAFKSLELIRLQLLNYWQYFDWQWARSVATQVGDFPLDLIELLNISQCLLGNLALVVGMQVEEFPARMRHATNNEEALLGTDRTINAVGIRLQ